MWHVSIIAPRSSVCHDVQCTCAEGTRVPPAPQVAAPKRKERRTDPPYPGWGSGGGRFARQPGQGVERVELDWNQFESSCELSCTIYTLPKHFII